MPAFSKIQSSVTAAAALGAVAILGFAGIRIARADAAERLYRERLLATADAYEDLRTRYNDAVRETAVTELLVEDRAVAVRVRTIQGAIETIETPFHADDEIYVDFALVSGRLWIRRVFDSRTAPNDAVIINPTFAQVDWDAEGAKLGRAVYRSLDDGRWVVTTSGDGSLALTQIPHDEPIDLAPPPELGSFDELDRELDEQLTHIGFREAFGALWGD